MNRTPQLFRLFTAALAVFSLAITATAQQQPPAKPKTLQEVFNESVKLYDAGQYAQALVGFQTILKHQPGYVYARNYAVKCEAALREGGKPGPGLEGKLAVLKIPAVNFESLDLGTVFQYLTAKSEELSGGKTVANFIYKGTEEDKKNKPVTLSLRDAPITEVIRYVGQLTGTVFTYEEFAVVGTPAEKAAPAPVADPATPPAATSEPFPKAQPFDPFAKKKR